MYLITILVVVLGTAYFDQVDAFSFINSIIYSISKNLDKNNRNYVDINQSIELTVSVSFMFSLIEKLIDLFSNKI